MFTTLRFLTGLACAMALGGCAIAPARLKPLGPAAPGDPHALLEAALSERGDGSGGPSLGRFIELWKQNGGDVSGELRGNPVSSNTIYRVTFTGMVGAEPTVRYYDRITPASAFRIRGIEHHSREGSGLPLIAVRENRGINPLEFHFPPEGIVRPLTAILRAGKAQGGVRNVEIDLLCPYAGDTVRIDGRSRPLAADFSAPWAELLSRTGPLHQRRILDVLTPEPKRETRLYLMEPYDPRKEPLIMIHGLFSSPLTWAKLTNQLWNEDPLRRRYQVWHYHYNTSAPALYSSRLLRSQLRELRTMLDPEGDDPAVRRTTLLTHSMGGLVGKALAVSPGDAFWDATFTVPPDQLRLSPEDRAALADAFEWSADPAIHRIIFIATPHRGSPLADNLIGRAGRAFAKPPARFGALYERVLQANPHAFTPAYRKLGEGRLDGIHALSPGQPTLAILAELPLHHRVKTHSIIGNRGHPGPLESSSDGVVPYWSSHVPGADSETIVPAGHGSIDHPDTWSEVHRLLSLRPGE